MKTPIWVLILLLLTLSFPLQAQEKIYSLALKQHEIEEAIQESLAPLVKKSDYVIKVRLWGTKKVEPSTKKPVFSTPREEALPGFELEEKVATPKITDVVESTNWIIQKMRIDLIMHKEISPSVDSFIRQTVPVISEMDPARGDRFNFVPIIPQEVEDKKEEEEKAATEAEEMDKKEKEPLPEEKKLYPFTPREWIYIGVLSFLLLLILILLWRIRKSRQNITALETMIEHDQFAEKEDETHQTIENLNKAIQERIKSQEDKLNDAILREENSRLIQEIIAKLVGRKDWVAQLVEEYGKDDKGVERLHQLIATLGFETSRKLFSEVLGNERYLELEKSAESIELSPAEEKDLLHEIRKGLFTKELTSPEETASDPFIFLKELSLSQIAYLIKDEPVKIKAIILSRLTGHEIAEIMKKMSGEERVKVALMLGKMHEIPLDLLERVAFDIANKAKNVPDEKGASFDGVEKLLEIISESDGVVQKEIINNLRVSDRDLSAKVEEKLFLFESIPVVPEEVLTEAVRRLPSEVVITSLQGASRELQERVILCFPEKVRRALVSSLKTQEPTAEEIKEKRKMVVVSMQELAAKGKISLRDIQNAWEKRMA